MAFTNSYDTTFPADTQLANLLGADLRNFRLDTQQRMAAISGLDAAKPTFNLDAQPANWVGILFFAIDTGKIYKFTNPGWTDVSAIFQTPSSVLYKNTAQISHTGTNTLDTIYTVPIPILAVQSILRITFHLRPIAISAGGSQLTININATVIFGQQYTNAGTLAGTTTRLSLLTSNQNNVNSQLTTGVNSIRGADGNGGIVTVGAPIPTAINTGVTSTLTVKMQNSSATLDSQTFDSFLVELL